MNFHDEPQPTEQSRENAPVDIVVRLVREAATLGTYPEDAELFTEAADEIVRLRVRVVQLKVEIEDLRAELMAPGPNAESDDPEFVPQPWHVINSRDLLALLRRSHAGEDPEILYLEAYVNADRPAEEEGS